MGTNDTVDRREQKNKVSKRDLLKGLGAISVSSSLAGCSPTSDGSDNNYGERVPTMSVQYFASRGGYTAIQEATMPSIRSAHENLGISFEAKPTQYTALLDNCLNDKRQSDYTYHNIALTPARLGPNDMTRWWAIDWAGGTGNLNLANYANCDYSIPAINQQTARTLEEREELVNEAHSVLTEDFGLVPVINLLFFSAVRTDNVDVNSTGEAGFMKTNPYAHIYSPPVDKESVVINCTSQQVEHRRYLMMDELSAEQVWNKLIHAPLLEWDHEFQQQNGLADSVELSDDGLTIEVTLRDATFHNGDPITSEDVKFTFDHLQNNLDSYHRPHDLPLESIEEIDDKKLEFNMNTNFPDIITTSFTRWGIFHKETWVNGGAEENPSGWDFEPTIGSGPFKLENLQESRFMELAPHDGHPEHKPDHNIRFEAYESAASMIESFRAGELDVAVPIGPGPAEELGERDDSEIIQTTGFINWILAPQYPKPPNKFRAMRQAINMSLNRRQANELAYRGQSQEPTTATALAANHPWYPPEDMLTQISDDPSGDVEGARQVLSDAGFAWDENDNLRYPPEADLSPLWPKGETPSTEDFPCLDEI